MYGEDGPSYDTEALARMGMRGSTSIFAAIAPRSILQGNCHGRVDCRDSVKTQEALTHVR